ncbi:MAG: hypothetical protein AAFP90_14410, partial [Planctomycetota bacterium]
RRTAVPLLFWLERLCDGCPPYRYLLRGPATLAMRRCCGVANFATLPTSDSDSNAHHPPPPLSTAYRPWLPVQGHDTVAGTVCHAKPS